MTHPREPDPDPGEPTGGSDPNLKKQVFKATGWSLADKWSARLLTLVVFAVLSRLVGPDEFGLIALATVVIALLAILVDSGLSDSLVQRESLDRRTKDSAFWLSVVMAVVLTLAGAAAAVPAAHIYDQPDLVPVLIVLSISLLFQGLSIVPSAFLRRELNFKALTIRRSAANIAGAVAGVTWAIVSPSVWALVAQYMVTAFVSMAVLWFTSDYRPGRQASRAESVDLAKSGSQLLGIRIVTFATEQGDNFVIGITLGARALGFYVVGYRIFRIITEMVTSALSSVALPAFSRMQTDLPRLRRAVLKATRYSTVVAAPIFAGMAVLAPDVIPLAFGDKWEPSIPVMQVLALVGLLSSVTFFDRSVLIAVGRARLELVITTIATVGNVIAFVIGSYWGIVGVAVALTIRSYLFWPLRLWALRTASGISIRAYLYQWLQPVLATAAMVAVMVELRQLLPSQFDLVLPAFAGAFVYLVALRLIAPTFCKEHLALLRKHLPHPRRAA